MTWPPIAGNILTPVNPWIWPKSSTNGVDRQRPIEEGGRLLRAVPVTLGLTDRQNAELVSGELTEGQEVVTGTEGAAPPGGRP